MFSLSHCTINNDYTWYIIWSTWFLYIRISIQLYTYLLMYVIILILHISQGWAHLNQVSLITNINLSLQYSNSWKNGGLNRQWLDQMLVVRQANKNLSVYKLYILTASFLLHIFSMDLWH